MGLETATYLSQLVSTNPVAGDPVSQGDDHLRLVKAAAVATCPVAAPMYPLTSATAQASTAGTSIDFTSIPSWAQRIAISFSGVSTSGTSNPIVQLGDSGGVEASGYLGSGSTASDTTVWSITSYTTGFGFPSGNAANVIHGCVTLILVDAATNKWAASGVLSLSNSATVLTCSGSKSTSATLDRVRITTVGGTDTFDAGTINIQYE